MSGLYQQATAEGTKYWGASLTTILSPPNQAPSLTFNETRRLILDGELYETPSRTLVETLVFEDDPSQGLAANIGEQIIMLDPATGLPTGETKTYLEWMQAFQYLLYSMYIHSAEKSTVPPK